MIAARSIKRGVRNHLRDVMLVQDMLNRELSTNLLVDGDYGGRTEAAVKQLQEKLHVATTGIVGQYEWTYLLADIDVLELRLMDGVTWAYDHINYDSENGKTFHEQATHKDMVVLHHTVSGRNAFNVADYFATKGYATHFVIGGDGTILQLAPLDWWTYHINMRADDKTISQAKENLFAQRSIGIEICCWGALDEKDGRLYNSSGSLMMPAQAQFYDNGYVGKRYYEKYTPEQVNAVKVLLRKLRDGGHFVKPQLDYNDPAWLAPSKEALEGKRGLISHTNVRAYGSKSDLHPQPDMMQMLQEL